MDNHNLRVYESVLGLLPSEENPTPMVCLNRVVPFKHAKVFAKLEWYNPFGAVKDRIADNLLRDAEQRGVLGDIKKLVEPTSGNTGLGLAMIANAKGYHLTTPLSEAIPLEKRTTLRFFGADVIELDDTLCPAPGAPEGAIARAMEISEQPDFHMLNQYENEANPDAHYRTTGPEVWKQTEGKVTHFVAGLGTCGTITGTGKFLKQKNPAVKVLGVHPEEGHDIPGVRSIRQLSQTKLYRPDEYDGTVEIKNEVAFRLCLRLNREESIIAGPSSGMALAGAFELVPDEPGALVVVIFPDNVFKYATSMRRHLPELFPAAVTDAASADRIRDAEKWGAMVENAHRSSDVIDVGQAQEFLRTGTPILIDVRTSTEYAKQHAKDAINVPVDEISNNIKALPSDQTAQVITMCGSGKRSLTAMLMLKSLGYKNVKSLNGGLNAWVTEGCPTE
jgi:cysteine synthase/rhodanese-related sulfurtransferase